MIKQQIEQQYFRIYPSLVQAFGLEQALLLNIYQSLAQQKGTPKHLELNADELESLVPFWSKQQLENYTASLVEQGALEVHTSHAYICISINVELDKVGPQPVAVAAPVVKRNRSHLDDIFDQKEATLVQHQQQLHSMYEGWQPTEEILSLLGNRGIYAEFATEQLDEFVLYYVHRKNITQPNWDQKFLTWVKNAWEKHKATRDRYGKREEISRSLLDINDTDW